MRPWHDWDLGFLCLAGDRLVYAGEQTTFALRADQIAEVRVGPASVGWLPGGRGYVRWRDPASGECRTFHLRDAGRRHPFFSRSAARKLVAWIEQWRTQAPAAAPAPPPWDGWSPPALGEVTHQAPQRSRLGLLLVNAAIQVAGAALLAAVLGLDAAGIQFVAIMAALTVLVRIGPYMVAKSPRREQAAAPAEPVEAANRAAAVTTPS